MRLMVVLSAVLFVGLQGCATTAPVGSGSAGISAVSVRTVTVSSYEEDKWTPSLTFETVKTPMEMMFVFMKAQQRGIFRLDDNKEEIKSMFHPKLQERFEQDWRGLREMRSMGAWPVGFRKSTADADVEARLKRHLALQTADALIEFWDLHFDSNEGPFSVCAYLVYDRRWYYAGSPFFGPDAGAPSQMSDNMNIESQKR